MIRRTLRDGMRAGLACLTAAVTISLPSARPCAGQPPAGSPRFTPLVKVIREIQPAIVALFTPLEGEIVSGSGTVIHPDGYVLTNNHVLPKAEGQAIIMNHSKPVRFEVVGRIPEADIALVRLLDVPPGLPVVPIGRSDDVVSGEGVVVAGNPGGRGTVFTAGIVSANDVLEDGPNALVMSNYVNDKRSRLIQFDAASNRGNSGGPLVNMEARVIGVVTAVFNGEQNVGLAIPINRVRQSFGSLLEPEMVHEASVGVRLDPLADAARVESLVADSPAAVVGLRRGDEVVSIGGRPVRHAMDWQLALDSLLPTRRPLQLAFRRDAEVQVCELVPGSYQSLGGAAVAETRPGLRYAVYEGRFNQLPDFSNLTAARSGVCETLDVEPLSADRPDFFAMSFEGYLQVEQDGLHRVVLVSDDGSRLFLDGQLLIDHDGNHPPKPAGSLVRLRKGLHPLRIEYFQGNGQKALELFLDHCDSRAGMSSKPVSKVEGGGFRHAL